MSKYGEPWVNDCGWLVTCENDHVEDHTRLINRAVACANALAGIDNPAAVRDMIEAARRAISGLGNATMLRAIADLRDALARLEKTDA